MVSVRLEGDPACLQHPLIVQNRESIKEETGLTVEDAVINAPRSGVAQIVVSNRSGFIQYAPTGACLGEAETAQVLPVSEPGESTPNRAQIVTVKQTTSETEAWRREKLLETIELPPHHDVFSLEDGERGETDLVHMEIDTGDASPRKQPPRRMPFAVRQEVARQLMSM